jgi:hypothetical protein
MTYPVRDSMIVDGKLLVDAGEPISGSDKPTNRLLLQWSVSTLLRKLAKVLPTCQLKFLAKVV